LVIAADEHSHVSNHDILQAADNCCGKGRIVVHAEDSGECEYKPKNTGEQKLDCEEWVRPTRKTFYGSEVASLPGEQRGGQQHEQAIIEHQAILPQVLRIQFLLHHHAISSSEKIIQKDVNVPFEVKCQIVYRGNG